MTETPSYGALEEHRETFDRIWWQWPERQNRSSSSWWFFILFPADEDGCGPRQLMFVILSRMSERIRVNDVVMPGMDIDRPIEDGVDRFNALSLGPGMPMAERYTIPSSAYRPPPRCPARG